MKINFYIPKIILLLLLILVLGVQSIFSNFVICFGEDGHVNLDLSLIENKYITIHHMTDYGESLVYSDNCIFLSGEKIDSCCDIIILLGSQFIDLKLKDKLALITIINPLFIASLYHCFDIVGGNAVKYFVQTSITPGIPAYSSCNIPLLI